MHIDPDDPAADWAGRRREAAAEHADRLRRVLEAETVEARHLLAVFVQDAVRAGLPTTALRARAHNGRSLYRTGLTGWYLRRSGSLAVDVRGDFYLLTAPTSLRSALRGAILTPGDPPLVVGKGGRDGESMPLGDLLGHRLDAGADWTLARPR